MDTTAPTPDATTAAGVPIVDRSKTAPFLIRVFVKVGGFHRAQVFEDGAIPTGDEQQIFTWKDATLGEVLITLRDVAPPSAEFRHPLARYAFRAVFADSASRGRFSTKELGSLHARDLLADLGSLDADDSPAPPAPATDGNGEDAEMNGAPTSPSAPRAAGKGAKEGEREARTLDELRFVPGDFLCVAVTLPKGAGGPPGELVIKGSAAGAGAPSAGWKSAGASGGWPDARRPGEAGPPGPLSAGLGRGGGHWRGRGGAEAVPTRGGRGGRGGPSDFGRRDEDERDRRVPPPRRERDRESPPPRRGGYGRGGRGGRSRSRSRSPPRRR